MSDLTSQVESGFSPELSAPSVAMSGAPGGGVVAVGLLDGIADRFAAKISEAGPALTDLSDRSISALADAVAQRLRIQDRMGVA
jgi:hypothetical protein